MVAILDPDAVPAVRLTVDEYLEADLPEGYHYELVDGVVQMSPTPGPRHDRILFNLNELLFSHRSSQRDAFAHISFRSTVAVPGLARVREPDIALYRTWDESARGRWAAFWKRHIPFLVVEVVSPDQADRDYEDKRDDYWKVGVEEYWIINPEQATFTVLTRGDTTWEERRHRAGESFAAATLPGLLVDILSILRP